MSLVSSPIVFCEGGMESYDLKVLNLVVPTDCLIVPAGSKHGMKAFVEGYFNSTDNHPSHLCFRDRDFDLEPDPEPKLHQYGKIFTSHRSCIENYLLDSSLMLQFWQSELEQPAPDINEFDKWFEDSARTIRFFQAARWTLAKVKGVTPPAFKTNWLEKNGVLSEDLGEDACRDRAAQHLANYLGHLDQVQAVNLDAIFDDYKALFEAEAFYKDKQYLTWFSGKNLCKALNQNMPKFIRKQRRFMDRYLNWASNNIDYMQFPDLVELKDRLQSL